MKLKESILPGVTLGTLFTGLTEGAIRLDKAINPKIYELFADSTRWYQYLTSQHGLGAAYLEHEPISALLTLAIVSTAGIILEQNRTPRK